MIDVIASEKNSRLGVILKTGMTDSLVKTIRCNHIRIMARALGLTMVKNMVYIFFLI